jgi:hypothetical protein
MVITYGTGFFGRRAKLNNQWVETKFFTIMFIPIFPTGSIFVTASKFRNRQGFDINLDKKSVIATYCRLFTFLLAAWFFYIPFGGIYYYNTGEEARKAFLQFMFLGSSFAAAWVYFCFYYGRATTNDIAIRTKIGSVTGIFAMPHWFDYAELKHRLHDFELHYKNKFPDSNWKEDLMGKHVPQPKRPILFALALFNCMVYDIPANDELYAKADSLYNLNEHIDFDNFPKTTSQS